MLDDAVFAKLLASGTPKPVGDADDPFEGRGALATTAGLARLMPPARAPPSFGLSPIPSTSASGFEPVVGFEEEGDADANEEELPCCDLRCAARAFLSAAWSIRK